MPVTAKLSRNFYDRLGDDAVNELVDWFNSVDLDFRTELRTLNDLNYARFDAKVEQRFAEQDARIERRLGQFETHAERKFADVDRRFAETGAKIDRRFAEAGAKLDHLFAPIEPKFDALASDLRGEIRSAVAASEVRLTRWMFAFWTTSIATQAGLFYILLRAK